MDEQFEYQKSELHKTAMDDYASYGRDDELWTLKNALIFVGLITFGYVFSLGIATLLE